MAALAPPRHGEGDRVVEGGPIRAACSPLSPLPASKLARFPSPRAGRIA